MTQLVFLGGMSNPIPVEETEAIMWADITLWEADPTGYGATITYWKKKPGGDGDLEEVEGFVNRFASDTIDECQRYIKNIQPAT